MYLHKAMDKMIQLYLKLNSALVETPVKLLRMGNYVRENMDVINQPCFSVF